ncbi:MAG: hypothetical protein JXR87_00105 [Candidatus Marinimicrobia bacterium]|nr:hypothetical protein [Candidatus Neomarinimicrobiota bacterium]
MKKQVSIFLVILMTLPILAQHKTQVYLSPIGNPTLQQKIEKAASYLLTEFNITFKNGTLPVLNENMFTESAMKNILALWNTKSFYCEETEIITSLVTRSDRSYEIRPVSLVFKIEGEDHHYEEGVILITPTGLIDDFYFGLENQRYKSLLQAGNTVTEFRRRQIILDFVENFRTAYNRKDLPYIQSVFSDHALIIVGKVIEEDENSPSMLDGSFEKKKVELIRLNKQEYVDRLTRVFKVNQFIKVGFDDIEIYQHPLYDRIYGVTLLQHWTSSNYSDVGYLFLMIDFKDEDNPMIHVRTWQPEKYTSGDEVIGLGDFEIVQ